MVCECSQLEHDERAIYCYNCGSKRALKCTCGYETLRMNACYCALCGKKYAKQNKIDEKSNDKKSKEDCLKKIFVCAINLWNSPEHNKSFKMLWNYVFESEKIARNLSFLQEKWETRKVADIDMLFLKHAKRVQEFKELHRFTVTLFFSPKMNFVFKKKL